MVFWIFLLLASLAASQALAPAPWRSAVPLCIGTACLEATLALGNPAFALDTREVTMDAKLPFFIQIVQDNHKTLLPISLCQLTAAPSEALGQVSTIMALAEQVFFWDRTFFLQPFPGISEFTNENVAGGMALGLGALYGISYAYYQYAIAEEEAEAQRKKEAMAAKKRTAAVKKKAAVATTTPTTTPTENKEVPVAVAVPAMSAAEELAVEKARARVEEAKRFNYAARAAERKREIEELEKSFEVNVVAQEEEEVSKRKRPWWKFWRRGKHSEESE